MSEKIIVVVGATGTQGGSVVQALLEKKNAYDGVKIRCLTRNKSSEKAKKLASNSKNIEVVECDISQPNEVRHAFQNAWAIFAVTNYWDPTTGPKEYDYAISMANIAKECQVKYYIWSSLDNSERITSGKYKVPHFTGKAKVDEHLHNIGLPFIIVKAGFYFTNILYFFPPKKDAKNPNRVIFQLPLKPSTKIPFFDPTDTGHVVASILQDPNTYLRQVIPMYGEMATFPQVASKVAEASGKEGAYEQISYEEAAKTMDKDLLEMLHYFDDFGYFQEGASNNLAKKLNPDLKDAKAWIEKTQPRL